MEKSKMRERIIQYMRENGTITTAEAFNELGCTRLSEYIRQIRKSHVVMDEWVHTKNRFGDNVRYKRFWLE